MEYNYITVLLIIGLSAIITYGLRVGGLLLSDRLPQTGKFKKFMDALPGTILLSLVAPGIVSAGFWGVVAASCTAVCTYKTKNVFLSMIIGVTIVAVHRQIA
ncbi:MAG: AzlD domain-containing protein [Desulfobacterales bacterium]|nr:AzlD domain-containing protein [Desulfobacterales bacterium]